MKTKNMTEKRRKNIKSLLGVGAKKILAGLSSEYCEQDEKEFKMNYGMSFKEAIDALETLIYINR